jgi:hypothetical protein
METCLGQACAILAGVRSPPLRGENHPRQDGLAGKTWKRCEGRFSRSDGVCASAQMSQTHARYAIVVEGETNAWRPNRAIPRWRRSVVGGGAESAPPLASRAQGRCPPGQATRIRGLSRKARSCLGLGQVQDRPAKYLDP